MEIVEIDSLSRAFRKRALALRVLRGYVAINYCHIVLFLAVGLVAILSEPDKAVRVMSNVTIAIIGLLCLSLIPMAGHHGLTVGSRRVSGLVFVVASLLVIVSVVGGLGELLAYSARSDIQLLILLACLVSCAIWFLVASGSWAVLQVTKSYANYLFIERLRPKSFSSYLFQLIGLGAPSLSPGRRSYSYLAMTLIALYIEVCCYGFYLKAPDRLVDYIDEIAPVLDSVPPRQALLPILGVCVGLFFVRPFFLMANGLIAGARRRLW